jgi:hypothetical protein
MNADAIVVSFVVDGIRPLGGCGALKAQADVVVNVAELFEFKVCGIQVRTNNGHWLAQSPAYRCGASGIWKPAILLPEPLPDAIGARVIAAMGEHHEQR